MRSWELVPGIERSHLVDATVYGDGVTKVSLCGLAFPPERTGTVYTGDPESDRSICVWCRREVVAWEKVHPLIPASPSDSP